MTLFPVFAALNKADKLSIDGKEKRIHVFFFFFNTFFRKLNF